MRCRKAAVQMDEKGYNGVPDWIVDSEKNRITVYNFVNDTVEEYAFGDDVPVGIYKDFSIKSSCAAALRDKNS